MIELMNIRKTYYGKDIETNVLKGVNLTVDSGEFVCIYGNSGSGKSTLLNIIGLLDQASEGEYLLDGVDINQLKDKQKAAIRNQRIGFVFQAYHLIQEMNVLENIVVPLGYAGISKKVMEILNHLNKKGMTIIMVTHDLSLAEYGSRIIHIEDGKIVER